VASGSGFEGVGRNEVTSSANGARCSPGLTMPRSKKPPKSRSDASASAWKSVSVAAADSSVDATAVNEIEVLQEIYPELTEVEVGVGEQHHKLTIVITAGRDDDFTLMSAKVFAINSHLNPPLSLPPYECASPPRVMQSRRLCAPRQLALRDVWICRGREGSRTGGRGGEGGTRSKGICPEQFSHSMTRFVSLLNFSSASFDVTFAI
jgi:hypothetical protein